MGDAEAVVVEESDVVDGSGVGDDDDCVKEGDVVDDGVLDEEIVDGGGFVVEDVALDMKTTS